MYNATVSSLYNTYRQIKGLFGAKICLDLEIITVTYENHASNLSLN